MIIITQASLLTSLAIFSYGQAEPLTALFNCENLSSSEAVATCFRNEAQQLRTRIAQGDVMVIDKAAAEERSRSTFGQRRDETIAATLGVEAPDRIESTLASAAALGDGKHRFTLADGSQWLQTDSDRVRPGMRAGQSVVVKRATLGSYFLQIENRRDIRVRRVD